MIKIHLSESLKNRVLSFVLVATMSGTALSLSSCTSKNKEEVVITDTYSEDDKMVDFTSSKIKELFPKLDDEIVKNSTLIILLEQLTPKDENNQISEEVISKFKNMIDTDNMLNQFNSFIDEFEKEMILNNNIVSASDFLTDEQKDDKIILDHIRDIVNNISKSKDKSTILNEFDKIYTLFVDEDEIEVDGDVFEIRDLSYANRAIAQAYARASAYFARDYITEEKYKRVDDRTNDQNNKSYIKIDLEILRNSIEETSELDVVSMFNDIYDVTSNYIDNKVNLSYGDEKDLVNYLNLKYISSDKVSTKDKKQILGSYDENKIFDTLLDIDAITKYNYNNPDNAIVYSNLLYGNASENDKKALDYVQFNTQKLLETSNKDIESNPYFKNLYKYFTKQDFEYQYKDNNGNLQKKTIIWQNISDGVNFVNYETIRYALNYLKIGKDNGYVDLVNENLTQSIQYIQNTMMNECEKVDAKKLIK